MQYNRQSVESSVQQSWIACYLHTSVIYDIYGAADIIDRRKLNMISKTTEKLRIFAGPTTTHARLTPAVFVVGY
jgi:hypothetical protein